MSVTIVETSVISQIELAVVGNGYCDNPDTLRAVLADPRLLAQVKQRVLFGPDGDQQLAQMAAAGRSTTEVAELYRSLVDRIETP